MRHSVCHILLCPILVGLMLMLPVGLHAEERILTLGVLAIRPKPETIARWQPLADYLTKSLDGYRVKLAPLDQQELVEDRKSVV